MLGVFFDVGTQFKPSNVCSTAISYSTGTFTIDLYMKLLTSVSYRVAKDWAQPTGMSIGVWLENYLYAGILIIYKRLKNHVKNMGLILKNQNIQL